MDGAILVSGGVDSSVALRLLHEQGQRLTAYYLKIWLEDELSYLGNCPWEEDLAYVREVCRQVGIPLEIVPLQRRYHETVIQYVLNEVKRGNTPNPDLLCNREIKFGAFLQELGDTTLPVATGHYAQKIELPSGEVLLKQSPDPIKDQTYFLALLSEAQRRRALFPIGHLTKPEVRAYAEQYNLPNKTRKDSQGICFLGKVSFADFLRYHLGEREGKLIEYETGAVLGTHRGFWFYTNGQRQGIGLSGGPWYVVTKNSEENTVYISRAYETIKVIRERFMVRDLTWFTGDPVQSTILYVKTRHGPQMHRVTVQRAELDLYECVLYEPDQGIASGQYAVFYQDGMCVGAGVMEHVVPCRNVWL